MGFSYPQELKFLKLYCLYKQKRSHAKRILTVQKIYNLEFFTQGVVGIIRKWMDLNCKTNIAEIVTIIKNCVGFSVK